MSEFLVYFKLGVFHILDFSAYDHMLFLLALCGLYSAKQWKQVVWLVTAFTIGHSLTLALAVFSFIPVNTSLIEFLIPVTIFITAISNFHSFQLEKKGRTQLIRYALAGIFGLIHGMGFSNYLRSLLGEGSQLIYALFAFNVGVEAGQILIVSVILICVTAMSAFLKKRQHHWIGKLISGFAVCLSLLLMYETKFW